MPTYVVLLRGINVGGRNKLAMRDLRAVLADLGHGDPRTYVQSGNAVFTSERTDVDVLARELAAHLSSGYGVTPAVLLRTDRELAEVVAANPFTDAAAADPTTVHVAFLPEDPSDVAVSALTETDHAPEELAVGDRVLYLHLPGGLGRSRLAAEVDRRLGHLDPTVRNWRTVTKLAEMVTE